MTLVLAIETATIEVGAAIAGPAGVLAAVTARPGRRHAETLHPAIEQACALAQVRLAELGAIAVDVGPGLFTGLRVGVAAAKGFAFALGLPAVALSSLEVLAAAAAAGPGRPVVAVVDVRRGELAWAIPTGDGATLGVPRLGPPAELASELATLGAPGGVPPLLVGDGARRYHSELSRLLEEAGAAPPAIGGDLFAAPPVVALAELALIRLAEDGGIDPSSLVPSYLRAADARINWTTRA